MIDIIEITSDHIKHRFCRSWVIIRSFVDIKSLNRRLNHGPLIYFQKQRNTTNLFALYLGNIHIARNSSAKIATLNFRQKLSDKIDYDGFHITVAASLDFLWNDACLAKFCISTASVA